MRYIDSKTWITWLEHNHENVSSELLLDSPSTRFNNKHDPTTLKVRTYQ